MILRPDCCVKRRPVALGERSPRHIVRKTWKTPFEKATERQIEYQHLHQIADSLVPQVREKFLDAVAAIRGTASEAELAQALEAGDYERIFEILGLSGQRPFNPGNEGNLIDEMLHPVEHGIERAGEATLELGAGVEGLEGAEHVIAGMQRMKFDLTNPHTVHAVRNHGFNLIRQITDDTRNGIRAIVAHAHEFGGHPYEQARQIKQLVGLTERQAGAVSNYRRLLEAGDSGALERELRDHRFDPSVRRAIREGNKLSPEQVDNLVQRYADRMLTMRAETIARTETINASRLGAQAAWTQAAEGGLLQRHQLRQGWMVTPDDRLCQYCAAVPDMNPDGVPLGGQFETLLGPVDGPTLHPNCRCTVYLKAF